MDLGGQRDRIRAWALAAGSLVALRVRLPQVMHPLTATDRLLHGELLLDGKCDVKTLASEAGVTHVV